MAEILNISQTTGVVLDPVYSGKAALQMLKDVNSLTTKGQTNQECRVLFIHTGGLLGFYDKVEQMSKVMKQWTKQNWIESEREKEKNENTEGSLKNDSVTRCVYSTVLCLMIYFFLLFLIFVVAFII